ncbi:MAG: histidine phosphatase family protein [Acidimicrobiales bacterium]
MTDANADPSGRLVVVRHGATEWSRSGRHTGRTDVPLCGLGEAQATDLARRLGVHRFALVLSSPLARARRTCALAGFDEPARVIDDLAEWDYGQYEGLTTDGIRAGHPGWSLWRDGAPGGETADQVGLRADRVVALAREAGGDVLAFAHGHVLRVVTARWLGLPAGAGSLFLLPPAGIGVLGWEREVPALVRWGPGDADLLA